MGRDYDSHKQNIYFTRRLMIRLSIFLDNKIWLSEEQVPSAPIELLNGKPKGFHHLGAIKHLVPRWIIVTEES